MTRYDELVHGAEHELNQYPNPRTDDGLDGLLLAQAQATLALAEQQRIANLIAYGEFMQPRNPEETLNEEGLENLNALDLQIMEALGLRLPNDDRYIV